MGIQKNNSMLHPYYKALTLWQVDFGEATMKELFFDIRIFKGELTYPKLVVQMYYLYYLVAM